jgi:hypothetical protein
VSECAIGRADLERQPPLHEHRAVSRDEAHSRIVDMSRLRRNAVEFENQKLAALEMLDRRASDIKASEVEAGEMPCYLVDA